MNLWKKIKWFLLSGAPAIEKPKTTTITVKDLKNKTIDTFGEYSNINKLFDEIIGRLKNINPTLFNYPRVAKYTSGKYESTLDWDGEE